ncbi:MAG: hypothetical protein WC725_02150 [Patescibacteria group bacterium]|jgi:hypothetical protein
MESEIKKILAKIEEMNEALKKEYARLAEQYGFSFNKKRVVFIEQFKLRNKSFKIPTWRYAIPQDIRHLLSLPFIYVMIFPLLILDFFLTIYNLVALPLYRIPRVKRKDHFVFDRKFLDYLNLIQKVNCLYCSYGNGLFSYGSEIAARTERYWCPIKAARRPPQSHNWYKDFADYGNPEEWKEKFNDEKAFVEPAKAEVKE